VGINSTACLAWFGGSGRVTGSGSALTGNGARALGWVHGGAGLRVCFLLFTGFCLSSSKSREIDKTT
jgi:hypothetical protein